MDTLILAFLMALGKVVLLSRLFGLKHILYFEKWVELFFAVGMPLLFLGTFHGALLAALSGIWLTIMLRVCGLFVKAVRPKWLGQPKSNR